MKIAIIGAGRVGSCLAYLLKDNYNIIGLTSLYEDENLRKDFNIYKPDKNIELAKEADIIFITTPDDKIKITADEIFENKSIRKKFLFHCSGCHPSTILEKAKTNNNYTGSIHPLQSVPNVKQGIKNLKNAYFCIEGDDEAINIAKQIISNISGKYFTIKTEYKPLYHLGAVFSSNYINALIYTTCKIYKKILNENDYKKIIEIISPLFTGTVNSIKNIGVIEGLTGPIVREDLITIENHLKAIEKFFPEIEDLYINLAKQTIEVAEMQNKNIDSKKILEVIYGNRS